MSQQQNDRSEHDPGDEDDGDWAARFDRAMAALCERLHETRPERVPMGLPTHVLDGADRCRVRGYHEFVMGLRGCRVCGLDGPHDVARLVVVFPYSAAEAASPLADRLLATELRHNSRSPEPQ